VSELLAESLLALPMGAHVSPAVAERVATEVARIVAHSRSLVNA
jgi:hypothetical protein